jgi:hypothetical protein
MAKKSKSNKTHIHQRNFSGNKNNSHSDFDSYKTVIEIKTSEQEISITELSNMLQYVAKYVKHVYENFPGLILFPNGLTEEPKLIVHKININSPGVIEALLIATSGGFFSELMVRLFDYLTKPDTDEVIRKIHENQLKSSKLDTGNLSRELRKNQLASSKAELRQIKEVEKNTVEVFQHVSLHIHSNSQILKRSEMILKDSRNYPSKNDRYTLFYEFFEQEYLPMTLNLSMASNEEIEEFIDNTIHQVVKIAQYSYNEKGFIENIQIKGIGLDVRI